MPAALNHTGHVRVNLRPRGGGGRNPLSRLPIARSCARGRRVSRRAFVNYVRVCASGDPNVAPGFTFVNTTLAGVWLAVAYSGRASVVPARRPLVVELDDGRIARPPVSGITEIAPEPLSARADRARRGSPAAAMASRAARPAPSRSCSRPSSSGARASSPDRDMKK